MAKTITYIVAIGGLLVLLGTLVIDRDHGLVNEAQQPPEPPRAPRQSLIQPLVAAAPEPLRTEPNILAAITRQPIPDIEVPPWADEMEGAILAHIAQQPGLELTELQVQCATDQCVIFLGSGVAVYEMGFDEFAREHGFDSARIYSMDGGPNRMVYLLR